MAKIENLIVMVDEYKELKRKELNLNSATNIIEKGKPVKILFRVEDDTFVIDDLADIFSQDDFYTFCSNKLNKLTRKIEQLEEDINAWNKRS